MAVPILRPRSIPEIVDAAFQLARGHFMPLLLVSVIVAIPSLIAGGINAWLVPSPDPEDPLGPEWVMTLPLALLSMIWTFIGYGAVTLAAADAYLGNAVDPGDSLKRALGRAGPLILGNMLGYFVMVLPFIVAGVAAAVIAQGMEGDAAPSGGAIAAILVIVAVFLFGMYWAVVNLAPLTLVTPVAALERVGPSAAWQRAKSLASGSKRRVLLLVLIAGAVIFGIVFGGFALLGIFITNENLVSTLSSVVLIPLWPVLGALFVVLYYDLRIRKEAFDLEFMAAGLEQGGATAATAPRVT